MPAQRYLRPAVLAAASAILSLPITAQADDVVPAAEIASAVSDHTYQGSMTESAFVEYYHADGSIKGENYGGKWRTVDGAMCFQYGDKDENCWQVKIDGPAMTLVKDGEVDGVGMLIKGNPKEF